MGSYDLNFKSFVETPQPEGNGLKPLGSFSFPLTRQSSIYNLTFDEFQNSLGKDFGSMNMDELLKNIWTAEETQAMASVCGLGQEGAPTENFNLQRQGSITLPRTLSQKTVEEVWKDLLKESGIESIDGAKNGSGISGSHLQQREPTLGEMTLEEFLSRAGVVREDAQPIATPNNGACFGEISQPNNQNHGMILGYQQPVQNNVVMGNRLRETKNSMPPIFPKQAAVTFTSSNFPQSNNAYLANSGGRDPIGRTGDASRNNGLVQSSVIQSGSPGSQLSSDGNGKSTVDTSSVSPSPYVFSGGARGRRSGGTLEKAMERRHRRMIKNRESAARSRARKQAYTLELEAEVAKLKEMNQELQRKQEEIMAMQKNQISETMNTPWGSKRRCLRRTLTGPW
ncbi:hypothetical protein RHSIM_Rhsim11G0165000 [Rhododendron simsii]|uniref:BZIP domain-containing protein n=1 Tax=Rhododendron simsii TaxID=118357 RepID=A0A834L9Y7_RHOSS|nr:hypothetical protein RHSIM_Rhsim11G0165000 [Rhododendron simsii]